MGQLARRAWRYLTAALTGKFNAMADPAVQLEQAVAEAQDQHRRLVEQAANVIANQKQTEMRLNRAMEDMEKLNGSARQALLMSDEASRAGDTAKAAEYGQAAEAFANRLIAVEQEVETLKQLHLQASQATEQAKAAVSQNAVALQRRLTERQKLLSQLDQAKLQEQVNSAMATLSEPVGQDVPSLDEVRQKIEARYAKALGKAELASGSVTNRMMEVEQAQIGSEARGRLAEMRAQLGLPGGAETAPAAVEGSAPTPEIDPGT